MNPTDPFLFDVKGAEMRRLKAEKLAKIRDEQAGFWETYARSIGYKPLPAIIDLLRSGSYGLRWAIGKGGRAAEDLTGWQAINWDDPSHRIFRYHNQPVFHGMATYQHLAMEAMTKDPNLAFQVLAGQNFSGIAPAIAKDFEAEHAAGYPWAKNNPDQVEDIILGNADPLLLAGWGKSAAKTAAVAAELDHMAPIVANIMQAEGPAERILAAKPLHGADVVGPIFQKIVEGARAAGASSRELAELLWTQGYRASPWSEKASDLIPFGDWVKRGGNLYSSAIRDLAETKAYVLEALKHEYKAAFSQIPHMTDKEAGIIQELLHRIPRDPWDPAGTFERNFGDLLNAGGLPQDLANSVTPKIFEKAKKVVGQVGAGWRGLEVKPGAPGMFYERYEALRKLEAQLNKAIAFTDTEEIAKLGEQFRKDRAQLLIDIDRHGGREAMYPWKPAYGPSAFEVQAVEAGKIARPTKTGKVFRGYELTRQGGEGIFARAEDFRKWIAGTASRVQRADNIDAVVKEAVVYRDNLTKAIALLPEGDPTRAELVQIRAMARHVVRDLKAWRDTPDVVKAIKQAAPELADVANSGDAKQAALLGAKYILNAYDKSLNLMRTSQLAFNPSWYVNNLLDSHILKNAAAVGEIHPKALWNALATREVLPTLGLNGRRLDFTANAANAVYGIEKSEGPLGALGDMMNRIENNARNVAGLKTYHEHFSRMIKAGVDAATADARAEQMGRRVVDATHFNYGTQSRLDKIARRVFMYPVFRIRDNAFWLMKAWDHPLEAYAATRIRQMQEQASFDRTGTLHIPFTNWGVDPGRRASTANLMELALHTDAVLTPDQQENFRAAKIMQAVWGTFTPPVETLLQAGGLDANRQGKITDLENVFNIIAKETTGRDAMPSDWMYQAIGKDPRAGREDFLERRAALVAAAYQRDGTNLTPEQAREMAQYFDTVSKLSNWSTSFRLVPATPGMRSATRDLEDVKWHLQRADPELVDATKAVLLTNPDFQQIENVLPKTPRERLDALRARGARDAAGVEALPDGQPDNSNIRPEARDAAEELGRHPMLQIFNRIFGSPADAAETKAEITGKHPQPSKDDNFATNNRGMAIVVPTNHRDPILVEQAARKTLALEASLTYQLPKMQGAKMTQEYVDSLVGPDGDRYGPRVLEQLANKNPNWSNHWEQYKAAKSDFTDGNYLLAPIAVDKARQSFAKDFRAFVASGGADAPVRAGMTLPQVQEQIQSGKFKLTGGLPIQAVDFAALTEAKKSLGSGFLYSVRKAYEDQVNAKYPDTQHWREHLKSTVYYNTPQTDAVVQQINEEIKKGSVAPDFWKDLHNNKATRVLYEDASIADRYHELQNVQSRIMQIDQDGRPVGLNLAAMDNIARNGGAPFIAALRRFGRPEVKGMLQKLTDSSPELMSRIAPTDPDFLSGTFFYDFNVRTGLEQHPVAAALEQNFAAQEKQTAPLTLSQGQVTRPPTAGERMAQQDFGATAQAGLQAAGAAAELFKPPVQAPSAPSLPAREFGYSSREFPALAPPIPAGGPDIVRDRPYSSVSEFLGDVKRTHDYKSEQAAAIGTPPPDYSEILGSKMFYRTQTQGPDGKMIQGERFDPVALRGVSAAATLANTGLQLAGEGQSDVGRAVGGLTAGISTFMTIMTFAPATGPAAPFVIGAAAVAATVGVLTGLGPFGHKKSDRTQEFEDMRRARQAEIDRQNAERLVVQNTRELQTREQTLARALNGGAPVKREVVQPHLAAFQRRPTFASRIGLVDQLTRELSGALKPSW